MEINIVGLSIIAVCFLLIGGAVVIGHQAFTQKTDDQTLLWNKCEEFGQTRANQAIAEQQQFSSNPDVKWSILTEVNHKTLECCSRIHPNIDANSYPQELRDLEIKYSIERCVAFS